MKSLLNRAVQTAALGASALALVASPAMADPGHGKGWGQEKHREWREDRREDRRGDWRDDRRYDDRRVVVVNRRAPVRVIHVYDYNRPDPRWHGYYANRYYTGGYEPVRVTRYTRIYRGSDDRYYCRRSDGTTGLIIGAALGGVVGNRLDRGGSGVLGTLLGASAGALIGREIDRGELVCR
jgi:hypothetical protein